MADGKNSGLAHGTSGSPQMTIENTEMEAKAMQNEERVEREVLIAELKQSGVKFTEKEVVFIAKDGTGQTVWLETGSSSAGLKHILDGNGTTPGHAKDFKEKFGIDRSQVGDFLNKVIKATPHN